MKCKHLEDHNQTYFQHMRDAFGFAWKSLKSSMYFLIHGLFPWSFQSNGSTHIAELNETLVRKKNDMISRRTQQSHIQTHVNLDSIEEQDFYEADDEADEADLST